jgi:hypothetical protein
MFDNGTEYKFIAMELQNSENTVAHYHCSFEIVGYGLQNINVRIKPANRILQDLHPELIKWKE